MKSFKEWVSLFLFTILLSGSLNSQEITMSFANPTIDNINFYLCADVVASADIPGILLDELNMRMYIDEAQMGFVEFRDPDPNYFVETGGETITGAAGAGQSFFGFIGDFVYIFDNLKRVGNAATEIAVAPQVTYLFEACFNSGTLPDGSTFFGGNADICPSLVFDKDQDGTGFSPGSDGLQAIYINPAGGPPLALDESTVNGNWDYYDPDPTLGPCAEGLGYALPELTNYDMVATDCEAIRINWNTEVEANDGLYKIYRRYDGQPTWELIHQIPGKTSFVPSSYTFVDEKNSRSNLRVYYNVNYLDYTDNIESVLFSTEEKLTCDFENSLTVFPNPAQDVTHVSFSFYRVAFSPTLELWTVDGRKVKTYDLEGIYEEGKYDIPLDIRGLHAGSYILKLEAFGNIQNAILQIF